MNLTLEMLEKLNACEQGVDWFKRQNDTDAVKLINKAIESGDNQVLCFANWGITRLLDRTSKIKYAVFAAEQVIEIYEKKYPEDQRPREAIEAAKKVIESNTEENRSAAYAADAAYAAYGMRIKILRYGITLIEEMEKR